jgi:hypothetical protein
MGASDLAHGAVGLAVPASRKHLIGAGSIEPIVGFGCYAGTGM